MRLKLVTTVLIVVGIGMMLAMPFALRAPSPEATNRQRAEYGVRMLAFFGVTCTVWLAAAGCAVVLARKTRQEYLEETRRNLEALVETSLRDHGPRT